jgi:hypothetical protein
MINMRRNGGWFGVFVRARGTDWWLCLFALKTWHFLVIGWMVWIGPAKAATTRAWTEKYFASRLNNG